MGKYKKAAVSLAVLTLILTAGITSAYGFAGDDSGNDSADKNRKNYSFSSERQQSVLEAFEEANYQAWLKIVGPKSKIARAITKENFNKFITARKLARQCRYDEALKLSRELGEELRASFESIGQNNLKLNLTKEIAQAVSALGQSDSAVWEKVTHIFDNSKV